jgi:protein-S-isoprenylcysteine O-methyltransferase Ste14
VTSLGPDVPRVVAPPPVIYLTALVLGVLLDRWIPLWRLSPPVFRIVGWPVLGGGVVLLSWFVLTMRRAGTPINPRYPASRLVTDGPFAYTRNPGYLALTLIYGGLASLANALWALLLLPLVLWLLRRSVIDPEERYLERRFRSEYRNYKARTRRWI